MENQVISGLRVSFCPQPEQTPSRLAGDPPNVMVDLNLSHLNVLAFHEAETAIEQGYAAMKDRLPCVLVERRAFS